eukprot:Nitzschia sp. Nitz4//scaffold27_size158506//80966//83899//NITZ4_002603-RA/size158506-processed-gene-0.267-mRNA-1//-1//CDS//3329545497//48//frame0
MRPLLVSRPCCSSTRQLQQESLSSLLLRKRPRSLRVNQLSSLSSSPFALRRYAQHPLLRQQERVSLYPLSTLINDSRRFYTNTTSVDIHIPSYSNKSKDSSPLSPSSSSLLDDWEDDARKLAPEPEPPTELDPKKRQRIRQNQASLKELLAEYESLVSNTPEVLAPVDTDPATTTDDTTDPSSDPSIPLVPTHALDQEWNQLLKGFSHPKLENVTWDQLVESEEKFKQLCSQCERTFRALFDGTRNHLYRDSDDYMKEEYRFTFLSQRSRSEMQPPNARNTVVPTSSVDPTYLEALTTVLPFWQRIRKEREILVDALQPIWKPIAEAELAESHPTSQTTTTTASPKEPSKGIFGWIPAMMGGNKEVPVPPPKPPETQIDADFSTADLLSAHRKREFAPTKNHYGKLVSLIYFLYPNPHGALSTDEWYRQRVDTIHKVIDPSKMSRKILNLTVRAHLDCGSLKAIRRAEKLCKEYPTLFHQPLWTVMVCYLQVTQAGNQELANNSSRSSGRRSQMRKDMETYNKNAAYATRQVCTTLLDSRFNPSPRFWSIGFQCLANTPPTALDGYLDWVEGLAKRKFSKSRWETLLNHDPTQVSKEEWEKLLFEDDHKLLQSLVQIFAKYPISMNGMTPPKHDSTEQEKTVDEQKDEYIRRSQQLLEACILAHDVSDLRGSIKRSTFHSVLQALKHRKNIREQTFEEQKADFDYAMTNILDRMTMSPTWYPNVDTWHLLFQLTRTVAQFDELWLRYELFHGLTHRYTMNPLKVAKYVLNAWADAITDARSKGQQQQQGGLGQEEMKQIPERAWHLFQFLYHISTPHLFGDKPDNVRHLYSKRVIPDPSVYILMWRICSRCKDWRLALKLYDFSKEQRKRTDIRPLTFASSTYTALLRCLLDCPDEAIQKARAKEIYDDATEMDKISESFLFILRRVHRELYDQDREANRSVSINDSDFDVEDSLDDDDDDAFDGSDDDETNRELRK